MFPTSIETDRLRLEGPPSTAVDLHELYRICSSDPGIEAVTRHLSWSPHESPRVTDDWLTQFDEQWADGEAATYVVRPQSDAGDVAGVAALDIDWERRRGTLGVWFRKRFWGRGYSAERALALVAVAFEVLDLDVVAVTAHVDNDNSVRAVDRCVSALGGRHEGVVRNELRLGDWAVVDAHRWPVTDPEWREATGVETPSLSFE